MKLNRSQRAQVVELLRCAADNLQRPDAIRRGAFLAPVMDAARILYGDPVPGRVYLAAIEAFCNVSAPDTKPMRLLEAALRVERKEWP